MIAKFQRPTPSWNEFGLHSESSYAAPSEAELARYLRFIEIEDQIKTKIIFKYCEEISNDI